MPITIVETTNLEKSYHLDGRAVPVLKGIDFRLEAGQTAAVMGPSGAGKSTFLHLLGLLDTPTGGSVRFEGRDSRDMSSSARARVRLHRIGFVFQFHHLLPEFTALENVMMPGLIAGLPWEGCRRRAMELLEQTGLASRAGHKPGELSGGEQQRAALARALMNRPVLVLADEPTGNLDRAAAAGLRELLWGECRSRGAALLVVTHNPELARSADRVLVMVDGRLQPSSEPA